MRDVVAGISVALILIPQSLAYAEIAGMPPYVGLFAAALPPLFAAPFASSPYLQTGPVAMTSLLTFGGLAVFVEGGVELGSAEYIALGALLALVVGIVRISLGAIRAGVIAYLMSQPVVIGFTSAAAILISASQVPNILGAVADGRPLLVTAADLLTSPAQWHAGAVWLAVATVVIVAGGRKLHPLFPGVLVAVIGGIVFASVMDYQGSRRRASTRRAAAHWTGYALGFASVTHRPGHRYRSRRVRGTRCNRSDVRHAGSRVMESQS